MPKGFRHSARGSVSSVMTTSKVYGKRQTLAPRCSKVIGLSDYPVISHVHSLQNDRCTILCYRKYCNLNNM